jgi:hypothetical protein
VVHSARELRSSSFELRLERRPATLSDVLPGFTEHDRVGIVVREPCGAIGASVLLLAAVTAFYDALRATGEEFFAYPDFFILHAGRRWGDHRRLDVWPEHKELVVQDDGESLLRAINDRAITRLLVPEGEPHRAGGEGIARETFSGAQRRIRSCLAYAAHGRARDADVEARGNAVTESYVTGVLERAGIAADRTGLLDGDGRPVEHYRHIGLEAALGVLGQHRA